MQRNTRGGGRGREGVSGVGEGGASAHASAAHARPAAARRGDRQDSSLRRGGGRRDPPQTQAAAALDRPDKCRRRALGQAPTTPQATEFFGAGSASKLLAQTWRGAFRLAARVPALEGLEPASAGSGTARAAALTACACAHTRAHARASTSRHSFVICTHACARTWHPRANACAHTHSGSLARADACPRTRKRLCLCMHARTHARTHIHASTHAHAATHSRLHIRAHAATHPRTRPARAPRTRTTHICARPHALAHKHARTIASMQAHTGTQAHPYKIACIAWQTSKQASKKESTRKKACSSLTHEIIYGPTHTDSPIRTHSRMTER